MKLFQILREAELTLTGGFAIATLMLWGLIILGSVIDLIAWIIKMIRR